MPTSTPWPGNIRRLSTTPRRLAATLTSVLMLATTFAMTAPTASASTTTKPITIGYLYDQNSYFYQIIQSTLSKLAVKTGGSVIGLGTNDDPATEAQDVQQLLQRKVSAIVMSPVSPTSSLVSVRDAKQAGVPVVCYNTCLSTQDAPKYVSANVESNNTAIGSETAVFAKKYIQTNFHGSVNILLLNCDEFLVCRQRKAGFLAGLHGVKVHIVSDQTAYAPDTADTTTQEVLTAHPDIQAVWGVNDGATEGAVAAIKAMSGSKVVVFGTDMTPEVAQLFLQPNHILQCTTGQDAQAFGQYAFAAVTKALAHQQVTPFTENLPGKFYSRADLAAVRAFLAATHSA